MNSTHKNKDQYKIMRIKLNMKITIQIKINIKII